MRISVPVDTILNRVLKIEPTTPACCATEDTLEHANDHRRHDHRITIRVRPLPSIVAVCAELRCASLCVCVEIGRAAFSGPGNSPA
jgi:hypothetical protein